MNKRNISQQTCCKSLICAFCWALFSFPLSISDLSLLIVSKRVSCFSVIICLLCKDKNVIQKVAPTTHRQKKLKLSLITSIVSLRNKTAKHLTVTNVTGLLPACFVGNSLNIDALWSSTKRSVWRNVKFGEEKKRRFCLNHTKPLKSLHPSLWTSQSCFLSSNWFSSGNIRLLINRFSKTEPAIPSRRLLGSAGRVGSLLVCTWCHGGHVDGQEQKHFSPLGTNLYFHVNSSLKNSILFTSNMAALSRGATFDFSSKDALKFRIFSKQLYRYKIKTGRVLLSVLPFQNLLLTTQSYRWTFPVTKTDTFEFTLTKRNNEVGAEWNK